MGPGSQEAGRFIEEGLFMARGRFKSEARSISGKPGGMGNRLCFLWANGRQPDKLSALGKVQNSCKASPDL